MAPSRPEFQLGLEACADQPTTDDRRPTTDERMFNVCGVKIFADGIPPNKTARMYDEYVGGGTGSLTVVGATDELRVADLRSMVSLARRSGLSEGPR